METEIYKATNILRSYTKTGGIGKHGACAQLVCIAEGAFGVEPCKSVHCNFGLTPTSQHPAHLLPPAVGSLPPERTIPPAILRGAAGLAVLSVARVGAGWSLSVGSGLVVARTAEGGWSAPSALLSLASSIGWQIGLEVQDLVRGEGEAGKAAHLN